MSLAEVYAAVQAQTRETYSGGPDTAAAMAGPANREETR